jgi:hypothetical protein
VLSAKPEEKVDVGQKLNVSVGFHSKTIFKACN